MGKNQIKRGRKVSGKREESAVTTGLASIKRAWQAFQVLGPVAFLVFFPAPAWTGIVPANFLLGTLNGAW